MTPDFPPTTSGPTSTSTTPGAGDARAPGVAPSPRRNDIQGLRAICMVQVLLFHAWHVGSPIGVDAFIMISAFLMASSFIRRSEVGRMPFFLERWANTFKRLLPPLVVVVLGTLVASYQFLPQWRWREILTQALASVTYWQNWRLVEVSADYYAGDHSSASPLQHLWSMSMQGQVFLLWPLLMTACVLLARALRLRIRPVAFVAFMALTASSLLWLLLASPGGDGVYFDTRARIWEFAFGSAMAVAGVWLRARIPASRILGWVGLGVLVLYSLVSIGTYPGPMAAVPMLAVSLVLLFPASGARGGVASFLSWRPLVALGDISYAVYLIHWPVFVIFLNVTGRERLGVFEGLLLIVASLAAAWLLTKLVDDPVRNWAWANRTAPRKFLVVLVSLAVAVVPIMGATTYLDRARQASMIAESGIGSDDFPGARVLLGDAPLGFTHEVAPDPLTLDAEWASFPDTCDPRGVELFDVEERNSSCGVLGDPASAAARVLIAGDSHTEQVILPQVEPLLTFWNWSGEAVLQGACSWGMPEAYEDGCAQRNADLLTYVDETQPDYVFLIVTAAAADSPEETLRPGVEELIRHLTERGIEVIGVRDNIRSEENLYECSADRELDEPYGGCLLQRARFLPDHDPAEELQDIDGFHLIDMTDAYCTDEVCPTIIGNVFVYMDANHLTKAYSSTVAPFFAARVEEALGIG